MGVRKYPGRMALEVMPYLATSMAMALVKAEMAPLLMAYPIIPGSTTRGPVTEDMLRILPYFLSIRWGRQAFTQFQVPTIFTW